VEGYSIDDVGDGGEEDDDDEDDDLLFLFADTLDKDVSDIVIDLESMIGWCSTELLSLLLLLLLLSL
jgi:hypothetical protein